MTPTEDLGWYQVEDRSAPGQVRRVVVALAERLGFVESRRSEVAVAATELGPLSEPPSGPVVES